MNAKSDQKIGRVKTIFITLFQGVEAKNILRTGIYARLIAEPDIQLVLFVGSPERAEYYRREFSHPRVVYEVAPQYRSGMFDRLFSALKFSLINTTTMDLRRFMARQEGRSAVWYYFAWCFNRLFARAWMRRLVRLLDRLLVRQSFFAAVYERYQPSLVFLAHLFDDVETAMLREAKRRGIRTIGFINSWDKLTARATLRLLPDSLIVFNELVKQEAIDFADMPAARIVIGGVPQYDRYRTTNAIARAAFAAQFGIAPERRIIVYAPNGKYSIRADGPMLDLLHGWIESGAIPNAALLVRFQPNDHVDQREIEKRPWLIYDIPGTRFSSVRGIDWDMNETDLNRLRDTLAHAATIICHTSSLSVDAAIFDVPVINVNFELTPIEKLSESPTQYYHMAHYQNALRTGGIRVVATPDELKEWVNRYLDHPEMDREGRARLVREQCGVCDGAAGTRIAERLLAEL